MGKADLNVRYKQGKDRNLQNTFQEDSFQIHVKKVVELTQCSSEDAAYVLCEYENDVDQAVLAILDKPDVTIWKENKRKNKNAEKDSNHLTTNKRHTTANRNQGDNNTQERRFHRNSDYHNKRGSFRDNNQQNAKNDSTTYNARSNRYNNNRKFNNERNAKVVENKEIFENNKNFPTIDSFSVNALSNEEENWKNGPLIFEASIPPNSEVSQIKTLNNNENNYSTSSAPLSVPNIDYNNSYSTYNSPYMTNSNLNTVPISKPTEKLSFAAIAAKSKKLPTTSVVSTVSSNLKSSTTVSGRTLNLPQEYNHDAMNKLKTKVSSQSLMSETLAQDTSNAFVVNKDQSLLSNTPSTAMQSHLKTSPQYNTTDILIKDSTTATITSAAYAPHSTASLTDKLKNDIGLSASPHSTMNSLNTFATDLANTSPIAPNSATVQNRNIAALVSSQSFQNSSPILDFISAIPNQQQTGHVFNNNAEFMRNAPTNANLDFQFGYQIDYCSTQQASVIDRLQHPQQNQQSINNRDVSSNAATVLSYTDTSSLDYQSNDVRNNGSIDINSNLSNALLGNNSGKLNGLNQISQQSVNSISAAHQMQNTQQQLSQQNTQQHDSSTISQQQQSLHQSASQPQPTQSSQHSLQQQQQQMYTAAQFPSYGFPYLYSPVAGMRDVEQFTTLTPFPYSMNQLDMQLNAIIPPLATAGATGAPATNSNAANSQINNNNTGTLSNSLNTASQNHHQISQQQSQPSTQHSQANKFQSQLPSGGTSSNLVSLSGNVTYQNLNLNSQQPNSIQTRNQNTTGLSGGILNNSTTTNNTGVVAPPPGFNTPHHFMPQQGLQSLFHMPSYGPTPMPFPLLFPGGPQQQSQQRQQPPQNHNQTHLLQSQNHQVAQRHSNAANLGMDHVNFMDMGKFSQQNSGNNSNSNLQSMSNTPYGNTGSFSLGSSNQGQPQPLPLHRNQNTADW